MFYVYSYFLYAIPCLIYLPSFIESASKTIKTTKRETLIDEFFFYSKSC